MKVALISGSPRRKGSASGLIAERIKGFLSNRAETVVIAVNKQQLSEVELKSIEESDVLVFSFPLYVDAIPSHLLSCLVQLDKLGKAKNKMIYAVVNCGFYEGIQADTALAVMKNWSTKIDSDWKYGLGVGGGGAVSMILTTDVAKGPKGSVDVALKELADNIIDGNSGENKYVSVDMPRFLYKAAAQLGWRKAIKLNGGKTKDLSRTP